MKGCLAAHRVQSVSPKRCGAPTLLFTTIRTPIHPYHRGAFWRLLAALQIQLNRSLSNPSARQRFSRAGLFHFLPYRSTSARRDLNGQLVARR